MTTQLYTPTETLWYYFVQKTPCIWDVRCRVEDVRYTDADLRRELATLVQGNSSMCAKLLLGKVPDGAAIMHSDASAALDLWGRCLVSMQLNDQQVPLLPRHPRGVPAAAAASPPCSALEHYLLLLCATNVATTVCRACRAGVWMYA